MGRFIELAKHCIGLDRKRPYTRHGKKFYKPYRNYFACNKSGKVCEDWETMYDAGYAEMEESESQKYFYLTRSGLDWLGEKIGVTIHNESD